MRNVGPVSGRDARTNEVLHDDLHVRQRGIEPLGRGGDGGLPDREYVADPHVLSLLRSQLVAIPRASRPSSSCSRAITSRIGGSIVGQVPGIGFLVLWR
jgi:hypothetical protein